MNTPFRNDRPRPEANHAPNPRANQPEPQLDEFPMRINKFLAHEGKGSRREIDRMVEEGKVILNGRVAVLGDKVNEGDKVEIKFRGIQEKKQGNEFAAKRRNQAGKRDR